MRDFNSFRNGGKTTNNNSNENSNVNTEENIKETINKYQDKSEDELLQDIFRMAANGKADGTLNNATLENFVEAMSPMLSTEQSKKLQNVINMLKNS